MQIGVFVFGFKESSYPVYFRLGNRLATQPPESSNRPERSTLRSAYQHRMRNSFNRLLVEPPRLAKDEMKELQIFTITEVSYAPFIPI